MTNHENVRASLRKFCRQEDGGFIVFGLFIGIAMLMALGVAVDVQRTEVARTKLQNTLDRAVLAAADLDQSLTAQGVVDDYFDRAGLGPFEVDVDVTEGLNFRTVEASTGATIETRFIRMLGQYTLEAPASGTANETITDVEISLVLDNSGSMNSNDRLVLLKEAAKDFIDIVIPTGTAEHEVSINIVPFATQVSAGPTLLAQFNATSEHGYSHCVNFSSSDFDAVPLSTTASLKRTGHFDVWSWSKPLQNRYLTCPTDSSRHISVMGHSKTVLKDKIDAMWAGGNTSIDVATKWGAALLDPSARSVIDNLVDDEDVHEDFSGRPYDYTEPQVLKVLVVMSDGENTSQYMLRDSYRSGDSPLFRDIYNDRESYYHNRSGTSNDYFYFNGDYWRNRPYQEWSRSERLTWPEVWASRSIANFAYYTRAEAIGGNWRDYYNSYYTSVSPWTKNNRTSDICEAARTAGITVYTVGMETYGQGDATLLDCVGGPEHSSHFFDVKAVEIGEAFSAIARDINRLRLTH